MFAENYENVAVVVEKTKDVNSIQKKGKFTLAAEIIDTGVVQDRGKTYGIYALYVCKIYEYGFVDKWHVYRFVTLKIFVINKLCTCMHINIFYYLGDIQIFTIYNKKLKMLMRRSGN